MTIPFFKLTDFLADIIAQDFIIYRHNPPGSKNLSDVGLYRQRAWTEINLLPQIWFHEQEPVMLFSETDIKNHIYNSLKNMFDQDVSEIVVDYVAKNGIKAVSSCNFTAFDRGILVHSELNSSTIDAYKQQGMIDVYVWSHALMARDWYRYAAHDPRIGRSEQIQQLFLMYNRAWSGTREYRLKLLDMIIDAGLREHFKTNFCEYDQGSHYRQYFFHNTAFRPHNELEKYFDATDATADYSAIYDIDDYNRTGIEVILETLFDDNRWHLTEKTLRSIACQKPFILVSTPGSLQYLHSYGFETFHDLWDESYDKITDSTDRLQAIVKLMKQLSSLTEHDRLALLDKANDICVRNRRRFLSQEFFQEIIDEYKCNMDAALDEISNHFRPQRVLDMIEFTRFHDPALAYTVEHHPLNDGVVQCLETAVQKSSGGES